MALSFPFEFTELEGSPKESFGWNGTTATREFRVPWEHRRTFAFGLLGGSTGLFPSQLPGLPLCRCSSVQVEPPKGAAPLDVAILDPELHLNAYDHANVTAKYESLKFANREDRGNGSYITYSGSGNVDLLTLPSRALRWLDTNDELPPDSPGGSILVPVTRHTLTWHSVGTPPWAVMSNLRGRVNNVAFSIPAIGLSAPPETVLYEGYETSIRGDATGGAKWEITYHLAERKMVAFKADGDSTVYGWNHTFRDTHPRGWYYTYSFAPDGATKLPAYPLADLTALFTQT